jgi:hypothetical protein
MMLEICPPTSPTFSDEPTRQAWISAHAGCPPPAAVATLAPAGLSTVAKVGIGVAIVAVVGGGVYLVYRASKP